ncbi:MAG: FHA domain-containing protein [Bacteriovoracaceae bacterium]
MLKKLLSRKQVPQNEGNFSHHRVQLKKVKIKKLFGIELANMEGAPIYDLTHQLTVGSEIGNIIIADPSVSPRHASFTLQDEVISVIDHGSVVGTLINGKKIPSGKNIILEENDVINIGDLEVKIKTRNESILEEDVPEIPSELNRPNELDQRKEASSDLKLVSRQRTTKSSNSILRVVAVICDLLLAYAFLIIFSPFDEFREFLNVIPTFVENLIGLSSNDVNQFLQQQGYLGQMAQDLLTFFRSTFHFGNIILMFVILRMAFTLILGVSLSEFLLSMRADGNFLWARFGGVLRVFIGLFTWPLLIFDAPSIISRRTFKEFLTYTRVYTSSKILAVLGSIILLPLCLFLAIISPLFQGLETPVSILINDRIDIPSKTNVPPTAGVEQIAHNKFFKFDLPINSEKINVIPVYHFQGDNSKLNFTNEIIFYHQDLHQAVGLSVWKKFNFQELLSIGLKGNPFLFDRFSNLYNFAFSASESNPAFRSIQDEKSEARFAHEFILFTKTAFELNYENAAEVMQDVTPLIKSLIDYKSSLLSLIEDKEFDKIDFVKMGNIVFMRLSYMRQRPYDLIIPLMKGEGRVFKVSFDKREDLGVVSSRFYKETMEKTNWLPSDQNLRDEVVNGLTSIDVINQFASSKSIQSDRAQNLYGHYFENTTAVLKRNDQNELKYWKQNIDSTFKIIDSIISANPSTEDDTRSKLYQNFKDLKEAVDVNNLNYFSISTTTNI